MLSRLTTRTLGSVGSRFTQTSSASKATSPAAADGERDLVNFPRRARPIHPSPVRMGFVPEEWFTMLYNKTGVTGPYVTGVGLITFLLSKEILVMEHEFYTGIVLGIMSIAAVKKFGPSVANALDNQIEEEKQGYRQGREDQLNALKEGIENHELCIEQTKGQVVLFEAKKENIGLQLEAAYRERLQTVHDEVKKRLDYQMETSGVKTRFEQRHMVDWIVNSVRSSITPQQEQASLKQCISDLKALGAKA